MRLPAYDGRKSLYTAGFLPFNSKDFTVKITEEDDGIGVTRSGLLRSHHLFSRLCLHFILLEAVSDVVLLI